MDYMTRHHKSSSDIKLDNGKYHKYASMEIVVTVTPTDNFTIARCFLPIRYLNSLILWTLFVFDQTSGVSRI